VYQHSAPKTSPTALFEHLFGVLRGVLITMSGRQNGSKGLAAIRHEFFAYPDETPDADAEVIRQAERGRDSYFGVHLYREPTDRKAENALAVVRSLWLDEDEGAFPSDGPAPTAVVQSSASRRHLYWRLTHPVSVEWAKTMNERIALWAEGDKGCAALARVLRPPGTLNYKRAPQVDEVIASITDDEWEPAVLEQAIPPAMTPVTPVTADYDGPPVEISDYLASPDLEVLGEVPDSLGIKYAVVCPWVHEHTGAARGGTHVGQRDGGGSWFHCWHDHCHGRTWREFKRRIRPIRRVRIVRHSNPNPTKKVRISRG